MHRRLAKLLSATAIAALSIGLAAGASGQDAPEPKPPEYNITPKAAPTPIRAFSDVAGRWQGMIDITTRVVLFIGADGVMKFQGPHDVTTQSTIENERLVLKSRNTELYCALITEFLACNARFDNWFAELSLRRP